MMVTYEQISVGFFDSASSAMKILKSMVVLVCASMINNQSCKISESKEKQE